MSDTKYTFPQFAFYDRTGIQRYLEKQALKGWMLEKAGTFSWKFARSYPRKLHFTVVYFPKADMFAPAPGEQEQTFREFCVHGGWTLAASAAQMQIFYSEAENPTPIETDPVIEVENIHNSMKKIVLPSEWVMLGLAIVQLLLQCWLYCSKPLDFLSSNLSLFMVVFFMVLLILDISQLARYYRWYKRARIAAEEDGNFVETKDDRILQTVICILLMVTLFAVLFSLEDKRKTVFLTLGMLLTVVVMVLMMVFRNKLKREGCDARISKKAMVIACVVLSIAVTGVGNGFIGQMIAASHWPGDEESGMPLSIEDLLGEGEYDTLVLKDEKSILLEYYDVMQVPQGRIRTPRIEYEAVKVKLPVLYERCLTEMMDVPSRIPGAEYLTIDPAPWGAESAWQLREAEGLEHWYVLCYEDTIVEFLPDWELTAEQMQTVGKIFG